MTVKNKAFERGFFDELEKRGGPDEIVRQAIEFKANMWPHISSSLDQTFKPMGKDPMTEAATAITRPRKTIAAVRDAAKLYGPIYAHQAKKKVSEAGTVAKYLARKSAHKTTGAAKAVGSKIGDTWNAIKNKISSKNRGVPRYPYGG